MSFESYASWILSLNGHENIAGENTNKKVRKRFQVKNSIMKITSIIKCQFARLNDKCYYFLMVCYITDIKALK